MDTHAIRAAVEHAAVVIFLVPPAVGFLLLAVTHMLQGR